MEAGKKGKKKKMEPPNSTALQTLLYLLNPLVII